MRAAFMVIQILLMTVGPILVFGWLPQLLRETKQDWRGGLLFGVTVAAWSSACLLLVPYCGGYTNLPSVFIVLILFGSTSVDTTRGMVIVHLFNFLIWPAIGWLVFATRAAVRRRAA